MTLREVLAGQARACADLGSPFNARLLILLAQRLQPGTALTDRLFSWPGDISGRGHSVPLRLAGALHALVLSGRNPGLAGVYPPNSATDDDLWEAVVDALAIDAAFIDGFIDSPPQTNEVGRSAVLIAAGHWLAARHDLPITLSELGASAGLNLNWDRYALDLGGRTYGPAAAKVRLAPENRGQVPPVAHPRVAARRGVDLNPIDLGDPAQRLRLQAYVWPDQTERLTRLQSALTLPAPMVDRGDAADWMAKRLQTPANGLHLVYHTIAWQYFPPEVRASCTAALNAAGARASDRAPLAHLSMEADGGDPGAALELTLWPGAVTIPLGRVDFHGRWLDWRPQEGKA